jgi:TRAP-type mannitol/chloroaromatic compound transport system substrate-binding protein
MDRRRFVRGAALGAPAAAALAVPSIADAQAPQVLWRCAGSFPKSTDILWACRR